MSIALLHWQLIITIAALAIGVGINVIHQGWHNITVDEELRRAVHIAIGFQGSVNTGQKVTNNCSPMQPISSPGMSLGSPITLSTSPPTSSHLEQLSRSPAFSLNSSQSKSNVSSEVKPEPVDHLDDKTGCCWVSYQN